MAQHSLPPLCSGYFQDALPDLGLTSTKLHCALMQPVMLANSHHK